MAKLKPQPQEIAIYDRSPASSAFVETFVWEPTESSEEPLGSLFVVGQIYSSGKRKEGVALLANFAAVIKDEYYRNPNREPLRSFKLSLGRAGAALKEKGYGRESFSKLALVVAALTPSRFFFARLGEGVVFLWRDDKLHRVENSPPVVPGRKFQEYSFRSVTEILPRASDILLLATKEIYKVNPETIRELVGQDKINSFFAGREDEFRNLGLVSIRLEERAAVSSPPVFRRGSVFGTKIFRPRHGGSFVRKILSPRAVTLSLVVMIALVLTTTALISQKKSEAARANGEQLVKEMVAAKERIGTLVGLGNYPEAETALADWEKKLTKLGSLDVLKNEHSRLNKEFNETVRTVKRYEQVQPRLALDLTGNTVDFTPQGLTGNANALFLFAKNIFYRFSLAQETGGFTVLPALAGKSGFEIRDLALESSDSTAAILLGNDLIGRYAGEFSALLESPLLAETDRVELFKNSFYLLGKETVWRLDAEEPSLVPWSRGRLFANARDFAIDGFIYVLEEGKIQKLLNGARHDELNIDPGIERIVTSAALANLYLLNPADGTVVVMDKFGNVLRRLNHEDILGARDIVVAPDEKTLWLLKDQKVFSINL